MNKAEESNPNCPHCNRKLIEVYAGCKGCPLDKKKVPYCDSDCHYFEYEPTIEYYCAKCRKKTLRLVARGCPSAWEEEVL